MFSLLPMNTLGLYLNITETYFFGTSLMIGLQNSTNIEFLISIFVHLSALDGLIIGDARTN